MDFLLEDKEELPQSSGSRIISALWTPVKIWAHLKLEASLSLVSKTFARCASSICMYKWTSSVFLCTRMCFCKCAERKERRCCSNRGLPFAKIVLLILSVASRAWHLIHSSDIERFCLHFNVKGDLAVQVFHCLQPPLNSTPIQACLDAQCISCRLLPLGFGRPECFVLEDV